MWSHLGYHLVASILLGGVLLWSRRWSQPVDEPARTLRWALLGGVGVSLIGQVAEAIGALGYPDDGPTNGLANVHDLGVVVGPIGIMLLVFSLIATGTLALAARLGFQDSRWFKVALGGAALAVAAFVVGGFVFGY